VLAINDPLTPAEPPLAVRSDSVPLLLKVPDPVVIAIEPPVDVDRPAAMETEPPTPALADPTDNEIEPPEPPKTPDPLLIDKDPPPALPEPELRRSAPPVLEP
jgi:hypothetical protein